MRHLASLTSDHRSLAFLKKSFLGCIHVIHQTSPPASLSALQHPSSAHPSPYNITSPYKRTITTCSVNPSPPSLDFSPPPPKRLAVFVSGGGSNFKAIHSAITSGSINATVAVVVTNTPTCGGAQYAEQHGIPVVTYPAPKGNPTGGLSEEQLVACLTQEYAADFVILAGYIKLIPSELVRSYHRSILNIHPGLLPSFGGKGYYGSRVHAAVLSSGARFSGPSIHFVDEEYDTGPILAQAVVPVYPTDSVQQLAARVLKEEHKLYPVCVAALCDGRVTWREDGIPIMWSAH